MAAGRIEREFRRRNLPGEKKSPKLRWPSRRWNSRRRRDVTCISKLQIHPARASQVPVKATPESQSRDWRGGAAEVHPHKTSDKVRMLHDLSFGDAWERWSISGIV